MIGITYLRFDYGLKAQSIERHGIHGGYRSVFQPYAGMYVVFCSTIFILVGGLSALWQSNVPDLVVAYINVPIFALFYVGYKIFKRTNIIPLSQLDFFTGIPSLGETIEKGTLEKPKGMQIIRQFVFLSFF